MRLLSLNSRCQVVSAVVFLICVSGCARAPEPLVFDDSNAKPGQFARDRYECLQQSQQPQVLGTANAYGANRSTAARGDRDSRK